MIRRDSIKKAGTTFAQLAMSVTALSGGANSYYRTQQGFYSPGKEMVAQLNAKPLSATAIQNGDWQKSLEPAIAQNSDGLELKKAQKARELIVVDSAVEDKHVIFKQAQPGVDIVEVEAGKDGMVELMKILSGYTNLDAVHIVSHAEAGAIYLGGQKIDQHLLEEDLAGFAAINSAIRVGGDLMIYGCDVARGNEGDKFLEIIKNNTHVDVAASVDKTGNETYSGNWELEIHKGDIEAKPLPESIAMKDFTGTLQLTGTKTFESWDGEYFSDDPSRDWDGFTTYISTPGTYKEILSGITCGDDLYVSMYYASQFFIRSNPSGEVFGITDLSIRAPSYTNYTANEVSIFGYEDGNDTAVGTKSNVPVSETETAIDLTTEITGSFAEIVRFRIHAENPADFCLMSVTFSAMVPTVTTTAESGVGATSATLGGEVTDDGGAGVTDSGIAWNTTGSPDIDNDNVVSMSSGTGIFSQAVGLLPFGTTIYVRAYATNSEGTAYGTEESFTTSGTVSVSLTGSEGWRLLSVPDDVDLGTFLDPIWTQGITNGATNGGDTDAGTPNVYTWSTAIDGNNQADWQAVTDLTNTTLAGGHGVLVQVYADPDYDGPTSAGFPQTLSVTGSEFPSGTSPTMNSNATGWTLLGNPFGSAIDYDELTKSNLSTTVYVWNPNDDTGDQAGQGSGSWETWNGSSGDLSDGRIAPFQGFLVENASTGSSVNFTQSSKTETATTFLGKDNPTPFVRLELQGNGMSNSTWLEFSSDGSPEKTDSDAWELTPLSTNYALLATRKSDDSLVDIGRYPDAGELEIPLVTEATQPGRYALKVTDLETAGQTLYLNDLQTGESIRLEKDIRYDFSIDQAAKAPADPFVILQSGLKKQTSETHRFVISSSALENPASETPEKFTLEQNYPNPFNPTTVINYQLPVNSEVRLEVFDMAGRQIATLVNSQQNAGTHSVNFNGSNLSSGVYMYRLEASGISLTKKLTLIK